jgi:hypothetical protein
MVFRLFFIAVILLVGVSTPSAAESTICSNPQRAGVLAHAKVKLSANNIDTLEATFEKLANSLGMTTWGVEASKNDGTGVSSKTIGLQSPQASVSISGRWKPGQRSVKIIIERTCYSDDLEPWEGYWNGLLSGLKSDGHQVP